MRRAGFVLPFVLAIVALGSVLVAAAFLMARLDAQSGDNSLHAARAFEAAESGLAEIRAWWDPQWYDTMAVRGTVAVGRRTLSQGSYRGSVERLSGPLFLARVEGEYQPAGYAGPARRALAAILRMEQPEPDIKAALTVLDTIGWNAVSIASGADTIPSGWQCSALDSAAAGVRLPPSAPILPGRCLGPPCLSGNPPLLLDSTVSDSTLQNFGPLNYSTLAGQATRMLTGSAGPIAPLQGGTPPSCILTDSLNWGEPLRSGGYPACERYFPIVHAPGDLTLTGGRGQGVLLVDGDLTLLGGTTFYGLVVVQGTLRAGIGGATVIGAALARRVALPASSPVSNLAIHYSACVLPNSLRGSSLVIPLPYRSWAQLF